MKKIVSIFLLIAMVPCLFGCGNKNITSLTTSESNTDEYSDTIYYSDQILTDNYSGTDVVSGGGNSSSGGSGTPNSSNNGNGSNKSNGSNSNNSNNSGGSKDNVKPSSNVKPEEFLGKDAPINSLLPHDLNPSKYHYTMTPADFFTKTGKEYSSPEAIIKRFNLGNNYDNKKTTPSDIISKSEILKVISLLHTDEADIKERCSGGNYTNEIYVKYAELLNYVPKGKINGSNYNLDCTKSELFDLLAAAYDSLLSEKLRFKLEDKYGGVYCNVRNKDQLKEVLNNIGFGEYESDYFSTDILYKGYLNKIIVKLCKDHGIIHYSSRISGGEKVKTDINTMPSNYHLYSYLIESIPNYVYEYPMYCENINEFFTPYDIFHKKGKKIAPAQREAEQYLDVILNVDYRTIDTQDFLEKVLHCDIFDDATYDDVQKYVNYLKKNEIVIKGHGKALPPIVYGDELATYIRTNVVFEISGKTNKNVLFGDYNVTYLKKSYNVYIDVPLYNRYIGSIAPWWNEFMKKCYKHTSDIVAG